MILNIVICYECKWKTLITIVIGGELMELSKEQMKRVIEELESSYDSKDV